MFASDKIIYLQMQKAGSTHATKVLQKYCEGRADIQHEQLKDPRRHASKLIVSSVRNPWDWYVSLWGFGCRREGGLRDYIDNLPLRELRIAVEQLDFQSVLNFPLRSWSGRPDWLRLYSDVTDAANFREWLKLLLGEEGQHIGLEGYAASPVKEAVGLMTYRFLALTTDYSAWMREGRKCRRYDDVVAFAQNHMIVNEVLRAETLNDDLLRLLKAAGVDVSPIDVVGWGKHNTTPRRAYIEYFDEETFGLVANRERFIVDRFGYDPTFPASITDQAQCG
jgi:hypothetical protein